MCGIAGILSPNAGAAIDPMLEAIRHRGPDDRQVWRGNGVALGTHRLAIVDRAGGAQPFVHEGIIVVCNGEIYNHDALRGELEQKGHRFQTRCDVEVVLHAYREWGSGFTPRLRGQFAFAIWDNRRQRLMLARDRYGIAPLVYTRMGGSFSFASEVKSLLQLSGVQRRVNRRAVDDFLAMRYAPGPDTFFEGIHHLPPGHFLLLDREGSGNVRKWSEPFFPEGGRSDSTSLETAAEALEEALKKSVMRRFQGEVPVGLYLSGGLDSAVVGAFGKQVARDSIFPAFSHGYDGKTDEISSARRVAKDLQLPLTEVPLTHETMESLPAIVHAVESPVANSDILGLWALAREASRSVRVVLCGEGADEIFGSYPHQQVLLRLQTESEGRRSFARWALQSVPTGLLGRMGPYAGALADPLARDRLVKVLETEDVEARYLQMTSLFTEEERRSIYTQEMREEMKQNPGKRRELIRDLRHVRSSEELAQTLVEIKMQSFLPDYHLGRENRIAMNFGLEARYPFLDEEVVQAMLPLPSGIKTGGKPPEKQVLRKVASRHLPRWISQRKKGPVRVPLWNFDSSFAALKAEYLNPKRIRKRGIVRPDAIESLLRAEQKSPFVVQRQLFALVMLEIWFETFRVSN